MDGKRHSYISIVPTSESNIEHGLAQLSLFADNSTHLFFLTISRTSHLFFTDFIEKTRPQWMLDFRPVPWFNFGNFTRKSVFFLFEKNKIKYKNVHSSLKLEGRRDSRIASGRIADLLNDLLPEGYHGPIVCLWDDHQLMEIAAKVLSEKLSLLTKREWKATISDASKPMPWGMGLDSSQVV